MPRIKKNNISANLGFEAQLWATADALYNNMDAAEYKHVVLGLIFLKYISDAFEEYHAQLQTEPYADPEDPDEYRAVNIFWVPLEARWSYLKANAKQPTIGQLVDEAMLAIERDNPSLKGVLPKEYARPNIDKVRLGQLIDLISSIGLGDAEKRSKDILGRVYEYFLQQFASAEGKRGGQFYTPRCVVQLLVEMLAPFKGRVYDPCCGSGGMFVQSAKFIEAHATGNGNGGHAKRQISVYGQESNYTTWRLCKMNLAIRGIDGQIAHGDSFHDDQFPDLKADYILANPPFNDSDWRGELLRDDKRWKLGIPPVSNANFAWVQHFIYHLAPILVPDDTVEMCAIVHILGTLDDKIELNRRMNETLEAMARAIFKSWFADFDPVIDNALKAGKPVLGDLEGKTAHRREVLARAQAEGCPAGLPEHMARLFPDEFEESELGWIPKGWRTDAIGEEFNLTM